MLLKIIALILTINSSFLCLAWGERGHDLIARVAVRLLRHKKMPEKMRRPFEKREHMIGHLANSPDIAWKQLPSKVSRMINPTHWIGVDLISQSPKVKNMPKDIEELLTSVSINDKSRTTKDEKYSWLQLRTIGTAPFRIEELTKKNIGIFLDHKTENKKLSNQKINQALLYAGILAHFVGDLANPHHTVSDYDSWRAKQGGLHAYFESILVNSFSLQLDQDVFEYALNKRPAAKLLLALNKEEQKKPLLLAWSLAIDSYKQYETVLKLDRDHALITESKIERGMHVRAKRQSPYKVGEYFKGLIISRLALAADLLSYLWIIAWQEGGKPDLGSFHSYYYFYRPPLLIPEYYPKDLKSFISSILDSKDKENF